MSEDIKLKISKILLSLGIDQWGVCRFDDVLPLLECRAAERLPKGAKSVIVCLFPYRLSEYPNNLNISKYAVVKDYHRVTQELLSDAAQSMQREFGGEYAVFADNSPIREVFAANLAGLGVIGQNGLLINKIYGSYVFIGEIVTDLDITEYMPANISETKSCLMCGLCEKSCPGGAIKGGKIDVSSCLSHITQKKGELTAQEIKLIAENKTMWGCDVCSDVCPMNKKAQIKPVKQFFDDINFKVDLSLTSKQLKEKPFGFRGKKVLERNAEILGLYSNNRT